MGLKEPPIGSYIAHSVRLIHSRKGTEAMAEFVAFTLDGEASVTWVRPIARITGIEVKEDKELVIFFFQGTPVVVRCGTQAEQLAREIMTGAATTPPLKKGNRLITSVTEAAVEPTHSGQVSQSPRPSSPAPIANAAATVLPPLRPAAVSSGW
jgi:hypothetical protein